VDPWGANSLADGNLVTGQNPASAKGVAQKMVAIMAGETASVAAAVRSA
jgi:putative intracellular protease/amidase